MTDPHQPEPSAGEVDSAQDQTPARSENQVGEGAAPQASSAEATHTEVEGTKAEGTDAEGTKAEGTDAEGTDAEGTDAEGTDADADDAEADDARADEAKTQGTDATGEGAPVAGEKASRKGVLLGVGGAVLGVALVALVLAAFAWPGFLAGPGTPDDTATRAVAALASKDAAEVDKISCRGPDGNSVSQLPPQALQLIQGATQTGAPQLVLDTQAQAPIALTLSAQGQTQDIQADVVLGVTNGEWCMTGISQQQQQQPPAGG